MITVARIFVRYTYNPDSRELRSIADAIFSLAESTAKETLPVDEIGIDARVQSGSTEIWAIVLTTMSSVLSALAAYGSAGDGLDRFKSEVRRMRDRIIRRIPQEAGLPASTIVTSRLTTGDLAKLERLIASVEYGDIRADEATERAERILLSAGDEPAQHLHEELNSLFKAAEAVPVTRKRRQPPAASTSRAEEVIPPLPKPARVRTKPTGVRVWRNPGEAGRHTEEY